MTSEIFRHFRPKAKERHFDKGGLSFLLRPVDYRIYNYWIYICPLDAEFSVKQATKSLRERADLGIKPWGTISISSEKSLLDTVLHDIHELSHQLPSDAPKIAEFIQQNNLRIEPSK